MRNRTQCTGIRGVQLSFCGGEFGTDETFNIHACRGRVEETVVRMALSAAVVNPLNLILLSRLVKERASALARGAHSHAAQLHRVYVAIQDYPIPITTEAQLLTLRGVGPVTVKLLQGDIARIAEKVPTTDVTEFKHQRLHKANEYLNSLDAATLSASYVPPGGTTKLQGQGLNLAETGAAKEAPAKRKRKRLKESEFLKEPKPPQLGVLIDVRESRLLALLSNLLETQSEAPTFFIEPRPLAVGDVTWAIRVTELVTSGDDDPDDYKERFIMIPWILERKTLADLEASIIDGRYKSQKLRLQQPVYSSVVEMSEIDELISRIDPRVFLLVESHHSEGAEESISIFAEQWKQSESSGGCRPLNVKIIQGAQINSQIRDGISVLHSANTQHSAQLIFSMTTHLENKQLELSSLARNSAGPFRRLSYNQWTKSMKPGARETVQTLYWKQLRCVPDVTANICDLLVLNYPIPAALIKVLSASEFPPLRDNRGAYVTLKPKVITSLRTYLLT
eukprot:Protomagalhaensia_sp_Gyna_25__5337@NODE_674_length_2862_cov_9_309245_g525_i0_p1_GENE_NODE_674_length_2862_cov_9_309245_g525_i0NODE_674_length_2862_cov_9_309245_g525_i0_p1_ORF_typecomplete_len508_score49_93ERCC4/PF02732_15/5_6e20_NODE_674_length_2862_cov_9_309245_g525_i07452268